MLAIRDLFRRLRNERGQAIILFVGIFTIIVIAAAIVIDFGLWFSERRGAQKDVDLITLAGAYELLEDTVTYGNVDAATQQSAVANDLDPLDDLHNLEVKALEFPAGFEDDSNYCHEAGDTGERPNAVVLDVDHESKSLFASIIGIGVPEIGAHACARAGSLLSTTGLRPWAVSMFNSDCFTQDGEDYVPLFGQDCIFRFENPASQVGSIRLGDEEGDPCSPPGGGANDYKENIIEGADGLCSIDDIVATQPGQDVGPTFSALHDLLLTEGECDALNAIGAPDGIDQFEESFDPTSDVPGPDVTFVARDCETPRAVHLVIIDDFPDEQGFDTAAIRGFAAFFLRQCEVVDGAGNVLEIYEKCDIPPGTQSNVQIRGFFMSILELEGDIGAFDPFGTKVIRLAE